MSWTRWRNAARLRPTRAWLNWLVASYGGLLLTAGYLSSYVATTPTTIPSRRKDAGMTYPDCSYTLLFSHPDIVSGAIRGFMREDRVEQVDFDARENVSDNSRRVQSRSIAPTEARGS